MLGAVLVTLACSKACIPDGRNGRGLGAQGMKTGQSAAGSRRRGKSRSWPCRAPWLQEETINELCVFVLIRMEASSSYWLLLLYGLVSVQVMNLWLAGALAEQRQSPWLTPHPQRPLSPLAHRA